MAVAHCYQEPATDEHGAKTQCVEPAVMIHTIDVALEWKSLHAKRYDRYCRIHSPLHASDAERVEVVDDWRERMRKKDTKAFQGRDDE